MLDAKLAADAEAEFKDDLDVYMEEWERDLRRHLEDAGEVSESEEDMDAKRLKELEDRLALMESGRAVIPVPDPPLQGRAAAAVTRLVGDLYSGLSESLSEEATHAADLEARLAAVESRPPVVVNVPAAEPTPVNVTVQPASPTPVNVSVEAPTLPAPVVNVTVEVPKKEPMDIEIVRDHEGKIVGAKGG